jgi:hypothetical protein
LLGTVGACVSTIHVHETADVEWLPARSIALTAKVCEASESDASVFGVEHAAYPAPSVEHSKVAPVGSLDENEKSGVESFETGPGFVTNDAVGGAASIVQVYESPAVEWLPAESIALTTNVCEPSICVEYVLGVEQLAKDPPSIEHSNVPPSFDVKAKVGVASFVSAVGFVPIVAVGGVASTVQV